MNDVMKPELLETNLIKICTLGSRAAVQNRTPGYYQHVISGCDWAGSDYKLPNTPPDSFNAHVMLGITPAGEFDILHMDQTAGSERQWVVNCVLDDHKRLGGTALASDFGAGVVSNELLGKVLDPAQHTIFNYCGADNPEVQDSEFGPRHVSINRNASLTGFFDAIRAGRIRCYDWDEAEALLSDCLCMSHKETPAFRYVRTGSEPVNTIHALNFAFTLGKIMLGEYPNYKRY